MSEVWELSGMAPGRLAPHPRTLLDLLLGDCHNLIEFFCQNIAR